MKSRITGIWTTSILCGALLVGAFPASAHPTLHPRVVGGAPVPITSAPWQVALFIGNNSFCGGSLIASTWVLTAAHCLAGAPSPRVFIGESNLSQRSETDEYPVIRTIIHPSYDSRRYTADLALIELGRPITPGAAIGVIPLPTSPDPASWPAVGTPAKVTGWGATSFGGGAVTDLREATVQVLVGPTGGTCGDYGTGYDVRATICAGVPQGGIDTCQGDSGGPFVIDVAGVPTLAGVTSIGNDCGQATFPGIYTRVTTYLDWIRSAVPVPAAAPSPPAGVGVSTESLGRVAVRWTTPTANGSPITGYTATAGERSCATTDVTCVIDGVPTGVPVSVTVTANNAVGTSAVSSPIEVVPVDGVTSVGTRVSDTRLETWAGIPRRSGDRIALRVAPESRRICEVSGDRVRMRAPGLCAVRLVVTRADGSRLRATTYVDVRSAKSP
ncbi:MAG: trypsin-like serine protease [Actinobacteria bacterium]|nr:trypsin-like serine protease [Actinomycetota bacterium]